MTDNGPYRDERQARAAALAVIPPEDGWSILRTPQCVQLLEQACAEAAVELGDYDRRILDWLAGFEDSACMVIAGLITRAAQRPEGTVTEWAVSYVHTSALFPQGRKVVQPYPDEDMAREAAAEIRELAPQDKPGVMFREVGPWTPVPGEEEAGA